MADLRWKKLAPPVDGYEAKSGDLTIGVVIRREVDQVIFYDAAWAVHMKWTAKTHGEVASFASGKRAVQRAWRRWLGRAGLAPAGAAIAVLQGLRDDIDVRRREAAVLAAKGWAEEKGGLAELHQVLSLIDRRLAAQRKENP